MRLVHFGGLHAVQSSYGQKGAGYHDGRAAGRTVGLKRPQSLRNQKRLD